MCTGWRVRDVFAHMTATAKMTPIGFVGKFAAAGFRFTVLTANGGYGGRHSTAPRRRWPVSAGSHRTTHPPGPWRRCSAMVPALGARFWGLDAMR